MKSISQQEYAQRRRQLMTKLLPDSIVIIPANPERMRNGFDNEHAYRQRSDFWYLTGFTEPSAYLVLAPGREQGEYVLFNRTKNSDQEMWTGVRLGQQGACDELMVDQAFAVEEFDEQLPQLLQGRRTVYYPVGQDMAFDRKLLTMFRQMRSKIRRGVIAPEQFVNIETIIHEQRLHKSNAEIACLRYANEVSSQAHMMLMQACQPGMYEYQLEGIFRGYCADRACRELAYSPIVGSGANTCILHYNDNNQQIAAGAMVLVDAGGEYHGYASDITRSFPANGKFSGEQRAVYEVVLHAQNELIAMLKPGVAWGDVQAASIRLLTQGMIDIGLLSGDIDSLIDNKNYAPYYPHLFGHWLGLDTHDAGSYCDAQGQWYAFESGMVTTVEPGIYVRPGSPCDERWWNIGVRLEDNVVITHDGHENLTVAPKAIADIEALMAR